jgi:hypothetical protein
MRGRVVKKDIASNNGWMNTDISGQTAKHMCRGANFQNLGL